MSSRRLAWRGYLPRRYAAKHLLLLVSYAALVLAVVQAVFLTEALGSLLEFKLQYDAVWTDLYVLLICTASSVFQLALPMSLIAAVYLVSLKARENREFLSLSSMGVRPDGILLITMAVGVLGLFIYIFFGNYVLPETEYLERATRFTARQTALREGSPRGGFYDLPEYTVYAGAATPNNSPPVFIHEKGDTDGLARVIASERARLYGSDASGKLVLRMDGVTIVDFPESSSSSADLAVKVLQTSRLSREILISDFFNFQPRGSAPSETSTRQLGWKARSGIAAPAEKVELGLRIARSLTCVLAPFFAVAGVMWTTRWSQSVALPSACGMLMVLDIAATTLVKATAPNSLLNTLGVLLVAATISCGCFVWIALKHPNRLLLPALGRS